jgi:hypothetical protein
MFRAMARKRSGLHMSAVEEVRRLIIVKWRGANCRLTGTRAPVNTDSVLPSRRYVYLPDTV